MSEPSRVVERVAYTVDLGGTTDLRAVNVRRNRTANETNAQYGRLYANVSRIRNREDRIRAFNRLQRSYTRVSGALAATGRDDEWADAYTLVGRAKPKR